MFEVNYAYFGSTLYYSDWNIRFKFIEETKKWRSLSDYVAWRYHEILKHFAKSTVFLNFILINHNYPCVKCSYGLCSNRRRKIILGSENVGSARACTLGWVRELHNLLMVRSPRKNTKTLWIKIVFNDAYFLYAMTSKKLRW